MCTERIHWFPSVAFGKSVDLFPKVKRNEFKNIEAVGRRT